ncbi:alpha/beta fold hydrolase [Ningiella sp. W23]|uniref:alpha/beta fold hydrolase n=1 Tax=Ningiella sp. W23 TaxID=3023715 RepID=UPI0037575723
MNNRISTLVEDGLNLVCYAFGNPNDNTIFMCPGLGATQQGFAEDATCFASKGFYVVTMDLRGQGESDRPVKIANQAFTLQVLASDIELVLHNLNQTEVHFVSNSLGGVIGLQLLRRKHAKFIVFLM